jgi:hypothetical protein
MHWDPMIVAYCVMGAAVVVCVWVLVASLFVLCIAKRLFEAAMARQQHPTAWRLPNGLSPAEVRRFVTDVQRYVDKNNDDLI